MPRHYSLSVIVTCIITVLLILSCGKDKPDEITIGCISPFSGNGAVYGEELKRGFDIYLDELKAADPNFYNNFKIIYEDDELTSSKGVNAINKLIKHDKVGIIIGAFTSDVTLAISPIAEKEKVLLLSPTATNYKIKDAGDYIFRVTPSDALQGKVMAQFVLNELKDSTASILFMNTDYGVGLTEVFQKNYEKFGGKVLSADSFEKNSTDMRTILNKVKQVNPAIIFLPSNYIEAVHVIKQAKELGIKSKIVGTDGIFDQKLLELTGKASEGIYISTMSLSDTSNIKSQSFQNNYKNKYNSTPGSYSALCYDALAVVVKAIKESNHSKLNLKDVLYDTEFNGVTGYTKFDEFGEVEKEFNIFIVKDNQFTKY